MRFLDYFSQKNYSKKKLYLLYMFTWYNIKKTCECWIFSYIKQTFQNKTKNDLRVFGSKMIFFDLNSRKKWDKKFIAI